MWIVCWSFGSLLSKFLVRGSVCLDCYQEYLVQESLRYIPSKVIFNKHSINKNILFVTNLVIFSLQYVYWILTYHSKGTPQKIENKKSLYHKVYNIDISWKNQMGIKVYIFLNLEIFSIFLFSIILFLIFLFSIFWCNTH